VIQMRAAVTLGIAVALIAGAAGLWWLIDSRARLTAEIEGLRTQVDAWERVCNADIGFGDPADDLGWLRRRAGQ
tara:strand:- start:4394 stop:4615 length:222 start_codon:yes stop_codon:yes gene_type:complete